jgi:hypothetical protein
MSVVAQSFDPETVEWRRVTDPSCQDFQVDFEFSLLGYDLATGRLDMLLRYAPGGHCRRHRHVASTVTLVLDGEQHLTEMQPDGSRKSIMRRKGEYAMAGADALPHDEWGGPEGGMVMLSMIAEDGILFEYFDADMENSWTLSIAQYVDSWHKRSVYGAAPAAAE